MSVRDSIENGKATGPVVLSDDHLENAKTLVQGCGTNIANHTKKLRTLESDLDQLAAFAGFVTDYKISPPINY